MLQYQVGADHHNIPNCLYSVSIVDLVCLICLWQSMAKIILEEVAKIVIVAVKRYCCSSPTFTNFMSLTRSTLVWEGWHMNYESTIYYVYSQKWNQFQTLTCYWYFSLSGILQSDWSIACLGLLDDP